MKLSEIVDEVLAELPEEIRRLVRKCVRFQARPRPGPEDLERGCEPDWQGYFYGRPCKTEDELDEDGGEVFYADEDDDVAEAEEYRPGGVIVLFTDNIRPRKVSVVREVLLHEIGHFLGEDEEDLGELGLGDFDEEGEAA